MSQPVKLSDELILDARLTAKATERSIAGQIEFWARLGRAIEPLLTGEKTIALKESGDQIPLSQLIAGVDTPAGKKRVKDYLANQPYPHYEAVPDESGLLVKIDESGERTLGRFINRKFEPISRQKKNARK